MRLSTRALASAALSVGLVATVASPGHAAINLTRDPVAFVYAKDHALSLLNSHATDDDLAARTTKLASSPWAFFRGTSPLYYRDLGELPASAYATGGNDVWIMGDAHLENFGADRGADNTEQYELTDTDDAWRGSWTWELRRMAVSIVLAERQQGRTTTQITTDLNTFVAEYEQWISNFHGNSSELTYRLTSSGTSDYDNALIQKAKNDTRLDLLTKWTKLNGSGVRVFDTANTDLATVDSTTRTNITNAIAAYRTTAISPFTTSEAVVKDVIRRKNAGTGSLGRFRWYALLEGKTTAQDDDRIMELKQEVDPAPKQLAPNATTYTGGERPARALEWLSYQSDNKAGWASVGSVPVLVKEKSPYAEDVAITDLTSSTIWDDTIRDDARLLAAGQSAADQDLAGTGVTYSADAAIDNAITSVSGLQSETRTFATDYADQVTRDWQAYQAAYNAHQPLY
ncbi:DUF2252 family protein [Nocardioides jejuensis]|uniref:DUF2252 domain-containing protein n=1 Tax=Nocardioides jejuensis TaxID=2502782 RepID=A0A4R1CIA5_9ACTN|nr:DUF2252 family protein [Nocardioides jejuensis]TCJ31203.1 DUF2252 domain-containing protein [Nocardioides jejuensis]